MRGRYILLPQVHAQLDLPVLRVVWYVCICFVCGVQWSMSKRMRWRVHGCGLCVCVFLH